MSNHVQPIRSQQRLTAVALLLALALLSHALDNCGVHLGDLNSPSGEQQLTAVCSTGPCTLCATHSHEPHHDVCTLLSEAAVLNGLHPTLHHYAISLPAPYVFVPAIPQVAAEAGFLSDRAQPPPDKFVSTTLRRSLPDRAPPISA